MLPQTQIVRPKGSPLGFLFPIRVRAGFQIWEYHGFGNPPTVTSFPLTHEAKQALKTIDRPLDDWTFNTRVKDIEDKITNEFTQIHGWDVKSKRSKDMWNSGEYKTRYPEIANRMNYGYLIWLVERDEIARRLGLVTTKDADAIDFWKRLIDDTPGSFDLGTRNDKIRNSDPEAYDFFLRHFRTWDKENWYYFGCITTELDDTGEVTHHPLADVTVSIKGKPYDAYFTKWTSEGFAPFPHVHQEKVAVIDGEVRVTRKGQLILTQSFKCMPKNTGWQPYAMFYDGQVFIYQYKENGQPKYAVYYWPDDSVEGL